MTHLFVNVAYKKNGKRPRASKHITVKSYCIFFSLYSCQLSINYNVIFFSTHTTLQKKLNVITLFIRFGFINMVCMIATSIIEVVAQ